MTGWREGIKSKKKKEGKERKKRTLWKLTDFIRKNNMRIIGTPEEEWEMGTESHFKQITENVPNLWK